MLAILFLEAKVTPGLKTRIDADGALAVGIVQCPGRVDSGFVPLLVDFEKWPAQGNLERSVVGKQRVGRRVFRCSLQ